MKIKHNVSRKMHTLNFMYVNPSNFATRGGVLGLSSIGSTWEASQGPVRPAESEPVG